MEVIPHHQDQQAFHCIKKENDSVNWKTCIKGHSQVLLSSTLSPSSIGTTHEAWSVQCIQSRLDLGKGWVENGLQHHLWPLSVLQHAIWATLHACSVLAPHEWRPPGHVQKDHHLVHQQRPHELPFQRQTCHSCQKGSYMALGEPAIR